MKKKIKEGIDEIAEILRDEIFGLQKKYMGVRIKGRNDDKKFFINKNLNERSKKKI